MTKLLAIAIASSLSVWLFGTAAFATTCEAKLTPLAEGETLVSGSSDARGAVFAVVRGPDGGILQQLYLMNDPAQMEGKIERPRYGSFIAIANFPIEAGETYSVSFVDLKKRLLCITYMQLKPTVRVIDVLDVSVSSGRIRVLAVDVNADVVENDEIVAAGDAAE
jgi:hypothetical protein